MLDSYGKLQQDTILVGTSIVFILQSRLQLEMLLIKTSVDMLGFTDQGNLKEFLALHGK